ncbi:MAG TPA: ribonuclease Z [Acidimicrobiales bacterium]|nr:ribonuclease Z [Acidimicrobiales bacterium]
MTELTFLGTGNFLAEGRYWNSFVMDGTVLVEPAPTVLPHLRRCAIPVADISVVVISHFHPDHTYGWPFFLLAATEQADGRPLTIVGPPDTEEFLAGMAALSGISNVLRHARARLDLRIVDVTGEWQQAGTVRFRAVRVDHAPHLDCFGYLFERGERLIGYTGDLRPCPGLDELAEQADVLVVECNSKHPEAGSPPVHMHEAAIGALAARHPDTTLVLTHMGGDVDGADLDGVILPGDFDRLVV